jgi:hypothetical protein
MRTATGLLAAVLTSLLAPSAKAQEPVSVERTLVRAAPAVLEHCRKQGYRNVGVLKFLVHKAGQDRLSDNAGIFNRTIARQLEMGLVLANDPKNPVGVIDDASTVAAATPGANHLTKDGRLKLFGPKYPLAWGTEKVAADAFVTGVIGVSPDLKTLTIRLFVFDKKTNTLDPVGKDLVAANDPRKLAELGESFTRGAFDDGKVEAGGQAKKEQAALESAAKVKDQAAPNPAADPAAPVKLDILYDGRPVPFEVRGGRALVPEPAEGQKVEFRLRRAAPGADTFACVLKVNGENTLFRQRLPDLRCRKWLLFPDDKAGIPVIGFQKNETTTERFRVLSKAASKAREIDYGADVGTITLTVFRDQKGKAAKDDLSEEGQNAKVLEQAKAPEKKPDNFNALTAQLLDDANRGLIGEGTAVQSGIRVVKFTADPTPVMSLTVVYYRKQ